MSSRLATSAWPRWAWSHRADGVLHIGRQRGLLALRVGHADQAGQRRAQVVRHRGKQRVAQLGFHADQRLLRHLDIMQALERDGDQRGVGFDLTPRFGIENRLRARPAPGRRGCAWGLQRQVEQLAVGQGGGAGAGGLAMVVHPLRQRRFQRRHVVGGGQASLSRSSRPRMYSAQREPKVAWTNRPAEATICSGSRADDSSRANSYRLRASASRLTETWACRRSPAVSWPINRPTAAARRRSAGTARPTPRRTPAAARRKIEQAHADHSQRRRPASVPDGHRHHRQQEQHDDIGLVQRRKGQRRQRRGDGAVAQRPGRPGRPPRSSAAGARAGPGSADRPGAALAGSGGAPSRITSISGSRRPACRRSCGGATASPATGLR